jgi:transcriptional regulator with XRE-family HTH domain
VAHTGACGSERDAVDSVPNLVLRFRLRMGLSQRQFGQLVGMRSRSIQAWEFGTHSPTEKSLRALIGRLLAVRAFSPGRELAEAADVRAGVQQQAPRLRTPFDHTWFTGLAAQVSPVATGEATLRVTRQHWERPRMFMDSAVGLKNWRR